MKNVYDVQKALREHADQGLDLTDPHGVRIHGRLYPTSFKYLRQVENGEHLAYADIPLESGNVASFESRVSKKGNGRFIAGLYSPTSTYEKNGNVHHEYWASSSIHKHLSHDDFLLRHVSPDDVQDVIKNFSQTDAKGKVFYANAAPVGRQYENQIMDSEDFKRHSKAFSSAPNHAQTHDTIIESPNGEYESRMSGLMYPKGANTKGLIHLDFDNQGFRFEGSGGIYSPHTEQLHRFDIDGHSEED